MRLLKLLSLCLLVAGTGIVRAQDTAGVRSLTMDEYEKARTFSVGDPDKDTYVKFDNTYILDHSGFGKPYFITGEDGKRKRIDLYKLILKEGRVELGTVIYYTTENGKRYTACMPGYKADPKVWRKYFEDVHAIEREEPFFVLKLSYVLSEELGFQLYRAANGQQGTAVNRAEAGTYGNDICFPGEMRVSMGDGSSKLLSEVRQGDEVVTVDPVTLVSAVVRGEREVMLSSRVLEATPNHPMVGGKTAGELKVGDKVWCAEGTGYMAFTVWDKTDAAEGMQHVYNIVAEEGSTLIMNGVMVRQK